VSRTKLAIPKTPLNLRIALDLRAKLDLELASELEGRVPYGDYSLFFEARLREHFESDYLILAPFGVEGIVKGPPRVIAKLHQLLETQSRQLKEAVDVFR
jgi:hypothetical protein